MNYRRNVALLIAIAAILGSPSASFAGDRRSARKENDDKLLDLVDEAIEISKRRYLTADVHTPWQILHGMLALRGEYQVRDKDTGKLLNAAEWMSKGVYFHKEPWFMKTKHGAKAHPYTRDYIFEGHPNQFLAIMSMAGFPIDYKFYAGKDLITVRDIVNESKRETNSEEETTWTLWAMSHYLGTDAVWFNKKREAWSIEKLVALENKKTLSKCACGGSHSLFALAYALRQYRMTGRPVRGVWLAADMRVRRYIEVTRTYQNRDGSFSSEYFARRGYSRDFEKRLSTTGHALEFLMMALPQRRIRERWVRRGVESTCRILIENKKKPAEPGALYHALDGLILFRGRMTGKFPEPAGTKPMQLPVVRQPKPLTVPPKVVRKPTVTKPKREPVFMKPKRLPVVATKPKLRGPRIPRAAQLPIPPKP